VTTDSLILDPDPIVMLQTRVARTQRNHPELRVEGQRQARDMLTRAVIDGYLVRCHRGRNHRAPPASSRFRQVQNPIANELRMKRSIWRSFEAKSGQDWTHARGIIAAKGFVILCVAGERRDSAVMAREKAG
jgi:hypothetical protein